MKRIWEKEDSCFGISIKKIMAVYIIVYGIVVLVLNTAITPFPVGEWDDYTLPIASMLNNYSFSISESDVLKYKGLFPDWANIVDGYKLSGYMTRDGCAEMTYYFPVYAIACIPYTLIFVHTNIPTIYTFLCTNLTALIIALCTICRILRVSDRKKLLLILVLSLNPIIFYVIWTSAEVLIYSLLTIGLVFWYNRMYRRAAVFVSIAGMLNPTIMSIGFFMIAEYLYEVFYKGNQRESRNNIRDVIKYGCCYIIGIIPMIYNYYQVGYINLTAAQDVFTSGNEHIMERFIAYLIDLNYGVLPYFFVIFCIHFVLFILAAIGRNIRYIEWIMAFYLNVFLYSIMVHINSGMSGISRYESWGTLTLLFAVILFYDEIIKKENFVKMMRYMLLVGIIITGIIVFEYGAVGAMKTSYLHFTPIAKCVLNNYPAIYNPLHSTFNSRVSHVDGGYDYKTPIVYFDEEGFVKKMLVKKEDYEYINSTYYMNEDANDWLTSEFGKMGNREEYITPPSEYNIVKARKYILGDVVTFSKDTVDSSDYVVKGLSAPEEWNAWIDGRKYIIGFRINSEKPYIHASINMSVYNGKQTVTVYVNGEKNKSFSDFVDGELEFNFENPGPNQPIVIKLETPHIYPPAEVGAANGKVLGLELHNIILTEQ